MQDNLAIQTLAQHSIGSLDIDRLGHLLSKDGTPSDDNQVIDLRLALMRVYFKSAKSRLVAKATKGQIKSAKAALASLGNATKQLDQAKPPRQRGLQGIFGSPSDDPKGLDELNEFGSTCSQIKLDAAGIMVALGRAIDLEMKKPKLGHAGERKKRLRTLVEALARWWKSLDGSLAPYVQAKRLDHRPAFVLGRRGPFIDLAAATFCKIDEFKESEVIAAVTNVYESQLASRAKPEKKERKTKIGP